jgi:hypothetical protein
MQRHRGAEPQRHARGLLQQHPRAQVGGDVALVDQQPQHAVADRGDRHRQRRQQQRGALPRAQPGGEVLAVGHQDPGQERLQQGRAQVEALDQVQHRAAAQQGECGQVGRAAVAAQAARQQHQPDAGGRGQGGGAL